MHCDTWQPTRANSKAPSEEEGDRYVGVGHVDLCALRGEPTLTPTEVHRLYEQAQQNSDWQMFKADFGASTSLQYCVCINITRTILRRQGSILNKWSTRSVSLFCSLCPCSF